MKRKLSYITLFGLIALVFAFSFRPAKADLEPMAVVELFTSQGCSSCPPADAFLGELSMRSDVLALAFHVDYWDYIGWKDPHADNAHTLRQRDYARTFNLRYIYTPQMVVNGTFETSGNKRRSIIQNIEEQLTAAPQMSLIVNPDRLVINGTNEGAPGVVYQVSFHPEKITEIRRGENRGRTLSYFNIVTSLVELGQWKGGREEFMIDNSSLDANKKHAFFVQRSDSLEIVAASRMQHE